MRLANDVSRCLGAIFDKSSTCRNVCDRRDTCARYVQRNTRGERTPYTTWICNGGVDAYIREEGKDAQPPNRQQAASTYMGTEPGVIENNLYFRTTINADALLSVARGKMCE